MKLYRYLSILLCLLCLPWLGNYPQARAITEVRVEAIPNIAGAPAIYKFHFSIEKKVERLDWITLYFPAEIEFPPPPDPNIIPPPRPPWPPRDPCCPGKEPVFDYEKKTITFESPIEIDPKIEGYRDIIITVPLDFGIRNPEKSGSYIFGIATKPEPEKVESEAVEIIAPSDQRKIISCEVKSGSSKVKILESNVSWAKQLEIASSLDLLSSASSSAFYISTEDIASVFDAHALKSIDSKNKVNHFQWIFRSNERVRFSYTEAGNSGRLDFSPLYINGKEYPWKHPPRMEKKSSGDRAQAVFVDIAGILIHLNCIRNIQSKDRSLYFEDSFGKNYALDYWNANLRIVQAGENYSYDYYLWSPVQIVNARMRIDLSFFVFHLLDLHKVVYDQYEPYQWEINYFCSDFRAKSWNFLFYYDSSPHKEKLKDVIPLEINGKLLQWNPIILDSKNELKREVEYTQVLAPLRSFFEAMKATIEWNETEESVKISFP
jgi:hypothetical protein